MTSRIFTRFTHPVLALALAIGTLCTFPTTASAASISVDGNAVVVAADGLCSLREAIHNAVDDAQVDNTDCAAGSGNDTIILGSEEEYEIFDADPVNGDNGLPVITTAVILFPDTLTIEGNGSVILRNADCTLDGTKDADEFRIFEVNEGVLILEDLTLEGGCADGGGASGVGGAIRVVRGVLTLDRVLLEGNAAHQEGGGLHLNESGAQIDDSVLRSNSAAADGGAIFSDDSQVSISRSTISANTAGSDGGGLGTAGGSPGTQTILRNSTVSGNTAAGTGGGLRNTGDLQVDASTVTNNAAGGPSSGGGLRNTGLVTVKNSIVAGNGTGGDCASTGTFTAAGLNYDADGTCAALDGDFQTVTLDDLALEPLAYNGGALRSLETHDLGFDSVAIDAVTDCDDTAGDPLGTDQRGDDRPQDGDGDGVARCDVGAVEAGEVIVVDGVCTLGDAIEAANLDAIVGGCDGDVAGSETIVLDVDTTLTAADTVRSSLYQGSFAGLPDVTSDISIRARAASVIERSEGLDCDVPDGPDEFRLLQVPASANDGRLELVGLTLRGGCADKGGAVAVFNQLDIVDSTFVGNTALSVGAAEGGAVLAGEGDLTISGSLFQGNSAVGDIAYGGAVSIEDLASLTSSQFVENSAEATGFDAAGGGLYVGSEVEELSEVVFDANIARGHLFASGGGFFIATVGSASQVLASGNSAVGGDATGTADGGYAEGGGGFVDFVVLADGIALVDNVAVGGDADSGTGGYAAGGGLYLAGNGTLRNLTVSGNRAEGGASTSGTGGAVSGAGLQVDGHFGVESSTVALNEAIAGLGGAGNGSALGGGLFASSSMSLGSSLLEQNTADVAGSVTDSDCGDDGAFLTSLGYNAVVEPTNCTFAATGDQTGVAPSLLPLDDYGCVTPLPGYGCLPTHPAALGSDAIDTGSCTASGITEDIREFLRPIDFAGVTDADDGCDVGAYESRDLDEGVGDGVLDALDNCPDDVNPTQADGDGDGLGDACDACEGDNESGDTDTDGVCDDSDICPGFDDGIDSDGDSVPDGCDICTGDDASGDGDGDGICADRDCDDNDGTNACAIFSDGFESGDTTAWSV